MKISIATGMVINADLETKVENFGWVGKITVFKFEKHNIKL